MKSGLGDSELDSIIQNIDLGGQKTFSQPQARVPLAKRKAGADQSTSPSKTKDGKLLLEEIKKVA